MLGINRFRRDIQTQGNKGQAQLLNIRGVSGSEHRKGARNNIGVTATFCSVCRR
ncbi:hypothetical protein BANRA_05594 [Klebsiella pneumoniae]|nr:hypothetical protein BANRA_05594 [Klebsiella pneumoniae]